MQKIQLNKLQLTKGASFPRAHRPAGSWPGCAPPEPLCGKSGIFPHMSSAAEARTDTYPEQTLPDRKLVDRFGQSTWKEWTGKVKRILSCRGRRFSGCQAGPRGKALRRPSSSNRSAWGGWKEKKLKEGTGYFSKCKQDGRWWLTDPEGYAYFSMGPDCVGQGRDIGDVQPAQELAVAPVPQGVHAVFL